MNEVFYITINNYKHNKSLLYDHNFSPTDKIIYPGNRRAIYRHIYCSLYNNFIYLYMDNMQLYCIIIKLNIKQ